MSALNPSVSTPTPPVEVRASSRRKRTINARWEDGKIVVLVPERLPRSQRDSLVNEMVERLMKRAPGIHSGDTLLEERAAALSDEHLGGVRPASIRWVGNQRRRWGSCNTFSHEIRISDRLRPVPSWVLDSVIFHELVHLIVPDHTRRFREMAARYPRMAEADAFLHGYSVGLESSRDPTFGCAEPVIDGLDSDIDSEDASEDGSETDERHDSGRAVSPAGLVTPLRPHHDRPKQSAPRHGPDTAAFRAGTSDQGNLFDPMASA